MCSYEIIQIAKPRPKINKDFRDFVVYLTFCKYFGMGRSQIN